MPCQKAFRLLGFFLFFVAGAVEGVGSGERFSFVFSVPVAQALETFSGIPQTEVDEATKRVNDFLLFLEDIARRVRALPAEPPPLLPGDVQFTGTGDREGKTSASFGFVPIFTSADQTFQIISKATHPITFTELEGLSPPFSYKGGSFPGTGGTCKLSLMGTCTLVLTFSPLGTGGSAIDAIMRNLTSVKLRFQSGREIGESAPLTIGGMSERNTVEKIAAIAQETPPSLLSGESTVLEVRIMQKEGTEGGPVYFKDVLVAGVAEPFTLESNGCAESVTRSNCRIFFTFHPRAVGEYLNHLVFSVNTGDIRRLEFDLMGSVPFSPETVSAARNLLVVYNADWSESGEAKNYYLTNRPGVEAANVLAVHHPGTSSCATLACRSSAMEQAPANVLKADIVDPVLAWLKGHPEKDIRFIVLMPGLPNRSSDDFSKSLQMRLYEAGISELSKEVFVTSLEMGSLEAAKRYIDKLKDMYGRMSSPSVVISARGTDREGSRYYLEDAQTRYPNELHQRSARASIDALSALPTSAALNYRGPTEPHFSEASDVLGYMTWGANGHWGGEYMFGSIRFSGKSNWYLIQTIESYNGQWINPLYIYDQSGHFQGNFIKWFSRNAFGGSDFERTPVAAVTHVEEPSLDGTNDSSLFPCWDARRLFAYCAWRSRKTVKFQAIGDPWVTR